jgi:hypothetical protein
MTDIAWKSNLARLASEAMTLWVESKLEQILHERNDDGPLIY